MKQLDDPRIDVVVIREPDYGNEVMVFFNGERVLVNEWHCDPEAGYTQRDWEEMRQYDVDKAPEWLKKTINEMYERFSDSEFIF